MALYVSKSETNEREFVSSEMAKWTLPIAEKQLQS